MLKWLIRSRLAVFERTYDYDMSYARDLLAADTRAFLAFSKVMALSQYRRDVPRNVYFAVKLVGTLAEDCGPCTQLMVTMALAEGMSASAIAMVLRGEDEAMTDDVRFGVRFARGVLARDAAVDELREEVVRRWGLRALISVAFALTAARIFPTIKYALGHGRACQRVLVDGHPIQVARIAAPAHRLAELDQQRISG